VKQIAPKCPIHLGREMKRVGEISKEAWAGKRKVQGFRYRCAVDRCPACETILVGESDTISRDAR
jgi:hypothetical protein